MQCGGIKNKIGKTSYMEFFVNLLIYSVFYSAKQLYIIRLSEVLKWEVCVIKILKRRVRGLAAVEIPWANL